MEFMLPEGVHALPASEGQVRIVRERPQFDEAIMFDKASCPYWKLLPHSVEDVAMLVLTLDQGSIGTAGIAYASHMGAMVHAKFDKYHRCVRDIKLSLGHCCGGLFLKAQLHSSFLWGINFKPFGTGLFGTQKKWLLNIFLATQDIHGELFGRYGWKIAQDMQMPYDSESDKQAVFDNLCHVAGSFTKQLEICKLGRWFSWNQCARQQMPEYHTMKMLLEHHLADQQDPDNDATAFDDLLAATRAKTPAAELAKLKSATGGLGLCHKLMTMQLLQHVRILYVVTHGCWSWYAHEVQHTKTPRDGLLALLATSQGKWAEDPHLRATVRDTLRDRDNLTFMGITGCSVTTKKLAQRALLLMWHILANRAWSLATRNYCPPECYVGLLSGSPQKAQVAAESMRDNWRMLMRLEQQRLQLPVAHRLWGDIHFASEMPIRMLHLFFEQAKFNPACTRGLKLLRSVVVV